MVVFHPENKNLYFLYRELNIECLDDNNLNFITWNDITNNNTCMLNAIAAIWNMTVPELGVFISQNLTSYERKMWFDGRTSRQIVNECKNYTICKFGFMVKIASLFAFTRIKSNHAILLFSDFESKPDYFYFDKEPEFISFLLLTRNSIGYHVEILSIYEFGTSPNWKLTYKYKDVEPWIKLIVKK